MTKSGAALVGTQDRPVRSAQKYVYSASVRISRRQQLSFSVQAACAPQAFDINERGSRPRRNTNLPVAPLWCDLEFFPNSRGNKAAANLRPKVEYTAVLLSCGACVLRYSRFRVLRVTVLCDRDHIVTGTVTSGRPGQARAESLTRNELTPPRQSLGLGLGGSSGSRPAAPPAAAEDRSGMITQIQLPLISSKFAQSDSDLLARECARAPAKRKQARRGAAPRSRTP